MNIQLGLNIFFNAHFMQCCGSGSGILAQFGSWSERWEVEISAVWWSHSILTYNILCCIPQFLVESHNQAVNVYKEESRGLVQPTLVSCSEILDSTMLVVVNDAGIRGPHVVIINILWCSRNSWLRVYLALQNPLVVGHPTPWTDVDPNTLHVRSWISLHFNF